MPDFIEISCDSHVTEDKPKVHETKSGAAAGSTIGFQPRQRLASLQKRPVASMSSSLPKPSEIKYPPRFQKTRDSIRGGIFAAEQSDKAALSSSEEVSPYFDRQRTTTTIITATNKYSSVARNRSRIPPLSFNVPHPHQPTTAAVPQKLVTIDSPSPSPPSP